MKRGVRFLALRALRSLEKRRGYSQLILHGILRDNPLTPEDRSLLTYLFYGVLQRRSTLDWIIQGLSRKGIFGMDPLLKEILRLGCYQLLYLDRVPAYAAINETVNLVYLLKREGWAPFVNALLRRLDREGIKLPQGDDPNSLGIRYSHPPWMVKLFLKKYTYGQTLALLEAHNQIPPLTIRVNTSLISKEDLLKELQGEGVFGEEIQGLPQALLIRRSVPLKDLPSFRKGYFYMQGPGAMVASHLLGGEEGEEILDLCGGPGGKSTHLAQLTHGQARIVALDIHQHRLKLIEENSLRLQINSIETKLMNALDYSPSSPFDRVLVDAPCSDLGLLGRKPEIRWFRREEDMKDLCALQLKLLKKGASLLKKRGFLLYCTCTLTQEENQSVVEDFLAYDRGFSLLDGEMILEKRGIGFRPAFNRGGLLEYLPPKSEGFFLALFKK